MANINVRCRPTRATIVHKLIQFLLIRCKSHLVSTLFLQLLHDQCHDDDK